MIIRTGQSDCVSGLTSLAIGLTNEVSLITTIGGLVFRLRSELGRCQPGYVMMWSGKQALRVTQTRISLLLSILILLDVRFIGTALDHCHAILEALLLLHRSFSLNCNVLRLVDDNLVIWQHDLLVVLRLSDDNLVIWQHDLRVIWRLYNLIIATVLLAIIIHVMVLSFLSHLVILLSWRLEISTTRCIRGNTSW